MHAYVDSVFDTQQPSLNKETLLNLYQANKPNDDDISVFIYTIFYLFLLEFLIIETALHFLHTCLHQPG